MIKIEKEEGRYIMISIHGRLDKKEYETFCPILENLVKKFDKISGVVDLSALDSMTLPAMLEELKLARKYRNNITRWALIAPTPILKIVTTLSRTLNKGDIKTFDKGEADAAWKWIHDA